MSRRSYRLLDIKCNAVEIYRFHCSDEMKSALLIIALTWKAYTGSLLKEGFHCSTVEKLTNSAQKEENVHFDPNRTGWSSCLLVPVNHRNLLYLTSWVFHVAGVKRLPSPYYICLRISAFTARRRCSSSKDAFAIFCSNLWSSTYLHTRYSKYR